MSVDVRRHLVLVTALLAVFGLAFLAACGDDDDGTGRPQDLTGTCLSCHQDEALLAALAEPEEPPEEDPGEG